jgi:hypothetical protein
VSDERRDFVARWSGRVADGAEDDHARFMAWLDSAEGADLLRRANLTEYAVYQQGPELEVVFKAERPSITAGFVRNRRLWPRFWEFVQPGDEAAVVGREALLHWKRA